MMRKVATREARPDGVAHIASLPAPPNTGGGVRCCRVQETRWMHQTAVSVAQATDFPRGRRIVVTAPLTETIDHAGYFIQMSMASLPIWLEGILNRKYPAWRSLEYND